jgi:transposase
VIELYRKAPKDGRVICFDECGPLEIRPSGGECWAEMKKPQRQPATYRRLQGTQQLIAFYDVHADCLSGRVRDRKTHQDILKCFQKLRRCYPKEEKLYLIEDNLSAHQHEKVTQYMKSHQMKPVWLPTYASWLNLIESHFGILKKFTIRNSYYKTKEEQAKAIYAYLYRRNKLHNAQHYCLNKLIKT